MLYYYEIEDLFTLQNEKTYWTNQLKTLTRANLDFNNLDYNLFFDWKKYIVDQQDPLQIIKECLVMRFIVILMFEPKLRTLYTTDRYLTFIDTLIKKSHDEYSIKQKQKDL